MSRTRYEWTLLDYAIWFAGAVTVPVYETSSAEQVELDPRRLRRPGGGRRDRRATVARRRRGAATGARPATTSGAIDDGAVDDADPARRATVADDVARGAPRRRPAPDDLATLIYTSGTTGRPKGCMLTHGNFLFELGVAVEELDELFAVEDAARPCCSCRWRTCSPG